MNIKAESLYEAFACLKAAADFHAEEHDPELCDCDQGQSFCTNCGLVLQLKRAVILAEKVREDWLYAGLNLGETIDSTEHE